MNIQRKEGKGLGTLKDFHSNKQRRINILELMITGFS